MFMFITRTQHAPAAAAARQGREGEAASAAAQCYHGWLFPLDLHFFVLVWVSGFFSAEKSGFFVTRQLFFSFHCHSQH